MSSFFDTWLRKIALKGDGTLCTESEIQTAETEIGHMLPEPFRTILARFNGPEEFIGQSYIAFFDLQRVVEQWRDSQAWAKGFVPIASNGAGELYGYDSRSPIRPYVLLPMIGMEWKVAMLLGATWDEFVETLIGGELFDRHYIPRSFGIIN